jgi:hypothetical protein
MVPVAISALRKDMLKKANGSRAYLFHTPFINIIDPRMIASNMILQVTGRLQ